MVQGKIESLGSKLSEALHSSAIRSESGTEVESNSKEAGDGLDSSTVTKKLEEELKKRDALIEVCYLPNIHILCSTS